MTAPVSSAGATPISKSFVSSEVETRGAAPASLDFARDKRVGADAAQQRAELKKAAQAFEAVFLRQMIGSMRQASFGDDLFGSSATDQFREMSDARVADSMSEKGALGIADMLISQLGKNLPQDEGAAQ